MLFAMMILKWHSFLKAFCTFNFDLMTSRDDLTRIEEQSRLEQEIRSSLIADARSPPVCKTEKKEGEEGVMDTLSEEQRTVYNTALEGYVNEYTFEIEW